MTQVQPPTEQEVRQAFEDVQKADGIFYDKLDLNAFLLGFCVAKGMPAKDAIPFVQENGVKEDGK